MALDPGNPLVMLGAALAALVLLDLVLAGGGLTSCAVCGLTSVMSTPVGWLGVLAIAVLLGLALQAGGLPGPAVEPGGIALAALLGLGLGLGIVALGVVRRDTDRPRRSPAERLRDRYAAGELTPDAYRRALVDLLKDRYVRGELATDEYTARLDALLLETADPPPAR